MPLTRCGGRLLTELTCSDYRVRERTALVGEPQNLVSYYTCGCCAAGAQGSGEVATSGS